MCAHRRALAGLLVVQLGAAGCGDLFLTKFEDVREEPAATGGTQGSGGASSGGAPHTGGGGGLPASGGGVPFTKPCQTPEDCPAPPDCRKATCAAGTCGTTAADEGLDCGDSSGVCSRGVCVERCTNGSRDGQETDIDCGGPDCGPCGVPQRCAENRDCKLGLCLLANTNPPALRCSDGCYADGTKNGGEAGRDCGSACDRQCGLGLECASGADCASGFCVEGICCGTECRGLCEKCEPGTGACLALPVSEPAPRCPEPASTCTDKGHCSNCANGKFDEKLGETGVDCGGSVCEPCPAGEPCVKDSDCASCICEGNRCQAKRCNNHEQDGCESDVDCGGACGPCGVAQSCRTKSDCATASCAAARCVLP